MKVRTFLFILLVMGVLYAMSSLFVSNREVLGREVHYPGGFDLSVGLTLLGFLLLGVAITTLAGLTREFGVLLSRRRQRREGRRSEEIEEEYSRGLVAVLEGREDEALGHFRGVLERDSKHFNTLLKIGEVLRHQEKFTEAIEFHRKAHHLKEDDTRPLYALVEDYEAKGDLDRARAVLGKIIGINKHSVAAWRKLRALYVKERLWSKALEAHQRVERYAAAADPARDADQGVGMGVRYEMASERLESGRARDAVGDLRKILKDAPAFIPAHVKLGEALVREGQESEGLESWYAGFERTGSPVFLTVLEEHFLQREQPLGAIEALKRCIAASRKDTLPRFHLGKLYFRLEMLDDALTVLSSLEGRASYAPTLHYLLGRIHERRKNHREASVQYRKVIKEMDLVQLEYRCRVCDQTLMEWTDRCTECQEWNTVEVNFREEISPEELGLSSAPVYTIRST
jgi:lipopolysaccharide biosynthesis regulator YciM